VFVGSLFFSQSGILMCKAFVMNVQFTEHLVTIIDLSYALYVHIADV